MPRLLSGIGEDISFFVKSLRLRFTRRLSFFAPRLQVEGSKGGDIVLFQERFNCFAKRYGISTPVTGVYDANTIQAVSQYQQTAMYILEGDGFVGPQTANALHIKLLEAAG